MLFWLIFAAKPFYIVDRGLSPVRCTGPARAKNIKYANNMRTKVQEKKTKAPRRKHDPFFRYIYAVPENARTLLRLAEHGNPDLGNMLSVVDLSTLELIPGSFSNVREWGESDLAFKARTKAGPEVFVGILLEHKSYRKSDVLSQIYRYVFEVMVNKGATDFKWLPTKAVIIYNGQNHWDPVAEFRAKYGNSLEGRELPFECVLVNLANILDEDCFAEKNVEAAVGAIVMKYAFDGGMLKELGGKLVRMLFNMENNARAVLVEKIELYLGEFLDEDIVQELKMRMSIGQALGIVTAGDRRRAAERAGRRAGMKKGLEKGLEKGLAQGLEKGMAQGMEKGLAQGMEKGLAQGVEQERSRNEAVNAKRVEFLRSKKVPEKLIAAMLAIK